ncbi:hypothetical protein ACF1B0_12985 [Streptomyces anandii]|uniref:hypothetical protein n=1 Tax=Streptomyces anandii TaxID=285454 RepID=UPI0036F87BEB
MFFNDVATAPVGDSIGLRILGMPSSWDEVVVTSPALRKPARLTPKSKGAADSAEVYGPGQMQRLRSDIKPGAYILTATFHGRTVATARLTVTAQADARIVSFQVWARGKGSDSSVTICLIDEQAAPDEPSLVAKSPAFPGPVTLTSTGSAADSCPTADGSDTLYSGRVPLRTGLAAGSYPVTVISHHGRHTSTQEITIGESAHPSRSAAGDRPESTRNRTLWQAAGGGACLLVVVAVVYTVRRRRRRATRS